MIIKVEDNAFLKVAQILSKASLKFLVSKEGDFLTFHTDGVTTAPKKVNKLLEIKE